MGGMFSKKDACVFFFVEYLENFGGVHVKTWSDGGFEIRKGDKNPHACMKNIPIRRNDESMCALLSTFLSKFEVCVPLALSYDVLCSVVLSRLVLSCLGLHCHALPRLNLWSFVNVCFCLLLQCGVLCCILWSCILLTWPVLSGFVLCRLRLSYVVVCSLMILSYVVVASCCLYMPCGALPCVAISCVGLVSLVLSRLLLSCIVLHCHALSCLVFFWPCLVVICEAFLMFCFCLVLSYLIPV
jgi:hypothetical protein